MMGNILDWAEGRSLLLVTHRVRGLQAMDQILLLRDGRIEARGDHQTLLSDSATYRQLCDQQQMLDTASE